MTTLNEFQDWALSGATYPEVDGTRLGYSALALAGEVGEVANEVKKLHRDDHRNLTTERQVKIAIELGDVLWYLAAAAADAGLKLETVAIMNVDKLTKRHNRQRPNFYSVGFKEKDNSLNSHESLVAFAAWLTSKDGPEDFGSGVESPHILDLVRRFAGSQNLPQVREDFVKRIAPYPDENKVTASTESI